MKMIIGGAFQGKLDFAAAWTGYEKKRFLNGADCAMEDLFQTPGIYNFHEYIRRCLQSGDDCRHLAEEMIQKNPDLVLVSNELGYGIVPVDPFERSYRETTGRVCTELAKASTQVVRVVCGIGTVIKDDQN